MGLVFIEPVAVPETYIDGIASIEQVGHILKLAFFTIHHPVGEPDMIERIVVARFAMPAEAVHSAAMKAIAVAETVVSILPTH
jgi:hypothetical protein